MQGGPSNDTFYAHPPSSLTKNKLVLSYNATNINSSNPMLTVIVNGNTVLSNASLTTSPDASLTSNLTIDLS